MKFIATTRDKVQNIDIVSGQLIFSRDERVIYLDTDVRTSFKQIITLLNEEHRQSLQNPIPGFYFIKDTKALWSYDEGEWDQVSGEAKENMFFGNRDEFPVVGEEKVLYVDEKKIYQWNTNLQDYIEMGSMIWDSIS